jgi:hypothetical protein
VVAVAMAEAERRRREMEWKSRKEELKPSPDVALVAYLELEETISHKFGKQLICRFLCGNHLGLFYPNDFHGHDLRRKIINQKKKNRYKFSNLG